MTAQRLVLLNTSILSTYGSFTYAPLTLVQTRQLLTEFRDTGREIISAIGHQTTAELLSALLEFPVAARRVEFRQTPQDVALVFKLRGRVPEGKILTRAELEALGYDFGVLQRTA